MSRCLAWRLLTVTRSLRQSRSEAGAGVWSPEPEPRPGLGPAAAATITLWWFIVVIIALYIYDAECIHKKGLSACVPQICRVEILIGHLVKSRGGVWEKARNIILRKSRSNLSSHEDLINPLFRIWYNLFCKIYIIAPVTGLSLIKQNSQNTELMMKNFIFYWHKAETEAAWPPHYNQRSFVKPTNNEDKNK